MPLNCIWVCVRVCISLQLKSHLDAFISENFLLLRKIEFWNKTHTHTTLICTRLICRLFKKFSGMNWSYHQRYNIAEDCNIWLGTFTYKNNDHRLRQYFHLHVTVATISLRMLHRKLFNAYSKSICISHWSRATPEITQGKFSQVA